MKADLDWSIESAGTNGYHCGEPPHYLSQKVASQNGININNQRSRIFQKEDMDQYDRIYAMSGDVLEEMKRISGKNFDSRKVGLLLNELYPGENRDVPDPWYGPEPGYHEVYLLIESACDAIIENYMVSKKQQSTA